MELDSEEKYIDIADKLKNLEKVEASHNFTHNLQAKIIELESEKRKEHAKRNENTKGGFLRDLLGNLQYPWLIPAAGFTILIFFVFYITYQNRSVMDAEKNAPITQEKQSEIKDNTNNSTETGSEKKDENKSETSDLSKDFKPESTESNISDKKNITSLEKPKPPVRSIEQNYSLNSETDNTEKKELSKPTATDGKLNEPEVTENQGMISDEKTKTRTMATVSPEAKDTNSGKKEKSSEIRSMMMKINKIDKEALEKIHDEITR